MGRGAKFPPQLGHLPLSFSFTQSRQNVHSNVQIMASVAAGAKSLSQHSQLGRSSSMMHLPVTEQRYNTGHFVNIILGSGSKADVEWLAAELNSGHSITSGSSPNCSLAVNRRDVAEVASELFPQVRFIRWCHVPFVRLVKPIRWYRCD